MKKTYLLLLTFFALATISHAQVSIIPKGGITLANMAVDDEIDGQKSKIGFVGGLGLNLPLSTDQFLSLQPELLYVQKGYAAKKSGTIDYDANYNLNYLELPVLLKFGFGSDVIRGYVNFGPSIGYLMNGRIKGSGDFAEFVGTDFDEKIRFVNEKTSNPAELNANRLELGANFGGGVGFALGAAQLLFDVRYNAGLSNVSQDNKSKNQVIYLTTGLKIPVGR